ncbi:MAG: dipeptidase PepE [Bacteroidales bacterium]|nr:dipeptidase PepE [Bacteroidales bacterium]
MRLLLISNSTNAGESYLAHCINDIKEFLGAEKKTALFIPYAAVTFSYDDYEAKVKENFQKIGHDAISIHRFDNPVEAVKNAEAIVVGGGNTFALTKKMQEQGLIEAIREKALAGTPYIGWSAGSNVACPTIRTTNDMPIVEPESFNVFNLVKFQINPHYLDAHPDGHAGETREMRIEEYLELNRDIFVVGLREGTMLLIENNSIKLIGKRDARIFKHNQSPLELKPSDDFSFLLNINA